MSDALEESLRPGCSEGRDPLCCYQTVDNMCPHCVYVLSLAQKQKSQLSQSAAKEQTRIIVTKQGLVKTMS